MPTGGGRYGAKGLAGETASTLKRQVAKRVSYINTKRTPSTKPGTGHLGTLKPMPNPKG